MSGISIFPSSFEGEIDMQIATGVYAAAALSAAAFAASMAQARVSDSDYIRASRCQAIAGSDASASADAEALAKFVAEEGRGRQAPVQELADKAAAKAKRDLRTDSAERKAQLMAELGGSCQAYKAAPSA
jgi:Skp family chaperone for outer membrane proteins